MRASQGHPDGRFIDGNAGKGMPNTGAQPGESPAVAMGNLAWPPEKNATECRLRYFPRVRLVLEG